MAARINEALPEDIFSVIFEEHAKLEWYAPLFDGRVCHQWRQAILRSPRAWAHLEIGNGLISTPSQLQRWLDRSGSVPLHILVADWTRGVEKVLYQHCNRIQSISLDFYSPAFLEDRSFPILQSLTINNRKLATPVIFWMALGAMPELHSFQAKKISMWARPSDIFPPLRVLVLTMANNCDCIIRNSSYSLTSLMLGRISLQYASESLEFPSLRFLSLYIVKNIKHRMNAPALTTYHESDEMEGESFPVSLPSLIEYGIYRLNDKSPFNVTKLHQFYPNISQLSARARPSSVKQFLHSLNGQPTALPMLRILAVDIVYVHGAHNSMELSKKDKESMMKGVSLRTMASGVKMELCFDGRVRFPLYFGTVRVYITNFPSKLTSILRTQILAIEDLLFILGLWLTCRFQR